MLKRHCALRLRSFKSKSKPRRRAVYSLHRGCLDALPCLVLLFTSVYMVFCFAAILRFSSRSFVHKLQLRTEFERVWMWILVSWVRMSNKHFHYIYIWYCWVLYNCTMSWSRLQMWFHWMLPAVLSMCVCLLLCNGRAGVLSTGSSRVCVRDGWAAVGWVGSDLCWWGEGSRKDVGNRRRERDRKLGGLVKVEIDTLTLEALWCHFLSIGLVLYGCEVGQFSELRFVNCYFWPYEWFQTLNKVC